MKQTLRRPGSRTEFPDYFIPAHTGEVVQTIEKTAWGMIASQVDIPCHRNRLENIAVYADNNGCLKQACL
ncbi:MAG: hypothetical protein KZQ80_01565 [Candidatus Thiodiazotropha sp. (ex Monitilora ramsayi)]|nr:hypothetical protein [Candidatus Thiodiazotropha sp. (ex Monitilora ramsayi)]